MIRSGAPVNPACASMETPIMTFVSFLPLEPAKPIAARDVITRFNRRRLTSSSCRSPIPTFVGIGIAVVGSPDLIDLTNFDGLIDLDEGLVTACEQ
jgi:hypothetical protein